MKIFKIVSVLLVLTFLLAGCGKDETTTPNVRVFPQELVGTWDFQSVTVNGHEVVMGQIMDWQDETVRADLTITADGDLVINEYSGDDSILYFQEGTFAVNNNYFTMTFYSNSFGVISPPAIDDGTWEVSGNQLTLYLNRNEVIAAIITTRHS